MSRVTSAGKAIARGTVIVTAVIVSAGCVPVNGPVSIGTLDGEFRVAVCEELIVDEAYASLREPGGELKLMWEATGQVTIPAGTVVNLAEDSFGMGRGLYLAPSFSPGSRLQFTFLGSPDVNTGTLAYFTVPEDGVEDGLWLTPDGDVQQTPCE